jgi:hypothetical protein
MESSLPYTFFVLCPSAMDGARPVRAVPVPTPKDDDCGGLAAPVFPHFIQFLINRASELICDAGG